MSMDITIRPAKPEDDETFAEHYLAMWEANGMGANALLPDAKERVLAFLPDARQRLAWQGFIAERDGHPVGSGGGQLYAGLYPQILAEGTRKYGYLWGIYVEIGQRRRGVARALAQASITYLRGLGCTRAIIHTTPYGRELFAHLRFLSTNEMYLDL